MKRFMSSVGHREGEALATLGHRFASGVGLLMVLGTTLAAGESNPVMVAYEKELKPLL